MASVFRSYFNEGTPITKTLRWQVLNANNFKLSIHGFMSNAYSGSHDFQGPLSEVGTYRAMFEGSGLLDIWFDDVNIVHYVKPTMSLPSGNTRLCQVIQRSSARESCPPNYLQESRIEYQWRSNRSSSGSFVGAWLPNDTLGPSNEHLNSGNTNNHLGNRTFSIRGVNRNPNRSYTQHRRTVYFCTPQAGCTGEPILHESHAYPINKSGTFSISIQESQSQESSRSKQEADARSRESDERARALALELETLRQSDYEKNQKLQQVKSLEEQSFTPTERTSKGTKYRVIDPVKTVIENGRVIPVIRYQSVRLLSPNNVSTLIFRKYEVQSVDPDTPLSSRSAYAPSVVSNSKAKIEGLPVQQKVLVDAVTKRNVIHNATLQEIIRFKARRRIIS